jgi:ADP-ribose pyrophosphatase
MQCRRQARASAKPATAKRERPIDGRRRPEKAARVTASDAARVGLCWDCRWARRVTSGRGALFFLCRRAEADPTYPKYPPLPRRRCAGHEPEASARGDEEAAMEPFEVLAEGRHLRLVRRRGWEYAERTNAVAIVVLVAVTAEGRLLLTEQHRVPVGGPVIELPAGLVGDRPGEADEDLVTAARRELLEETGYEAGAVRPLAAGPPSAGLSSEVVTFLLAGDLRRVAAGGGDEHEAITVHEVPLTTVADWLAAQARAGRLVDPKVYAGLYLLRGNSR